MDSISSESDEVLLPNFPLKIVSITYPNNLSTKNDYIQHLIQPIYTSQTFKQFHSSYQQFIDNDQVKDLFQNVKVKVDYESGVGSTDGKIPCRVNIDMKEKKKLTLRTYTSTNTNFSQAFLKTTLSFNNAFGRGERVSALLSGTQNRNVKDYAISISKPLFMWGKDISTEASLTRDLIAHPNYTLNSDKIISSLRAGSHVFSYEGSLRDVTLGPKCTEGLLLEGGQHVKSSIRHEWSHDTRDSKTDPTNGTALRLYHEYSGLGGDVYHFSQQVGVQKHWPVYNGWTFHLGAKCGIHVPLFGSRSYISDRYFLGGINTSHPLRGFDEKGIGPRRKDDSFGGDIFYTSSLHLSYPVQKLEIGTIKGYVFGQVGNLELWNPLWKHEKNKGLFTEPTRVAVGTGVALSIQGFRVELNYTQPINAHKSDIISNVQFGISLDSFI